MPPSSRDDYRVAIVCPMGHELAPVEAMMDEKFPSPDTYTQGRIGNHLAVVAVMPEIGTNRAATVVARLLNDFHRIQYGFLVGIGGGIPDGHEYDIRLCESAKGYRKRRSAI